MGIRFPAMRACCKIPVCRQVCSVGVGALDDPNCFSTSMGEKQSHFRGSGTKSSHRGPILFRGVEGAAPYAVIPACQIGI